MFSNSTGGRAKARPSSQFNFDFAPPSKLSKLKPRPSKISCGACSAAIEADNSFLQSAKVCRTCAGIYAKVNQLLNEKATRAAIEKTRAAKLRAWEANDSKLR